MKTIRMLIVTAVAVQISASAAEATFKRRDEIPVPATETVEYREQKWHNIVTRIFGFGYGPVKEGRIHYGGVLRVAKDRPGPGGEILVSYQRRNAPEGGNAHCKNGTMLEIPQSTLKFYQKFYELKQEAIREINEMLGEDALASQRAADVTFPPSAPSAAGQAVPIAAEHFVTVANVNPFVHDGALVAQIGDRLKIREGGGPATPDEYRHFKVAKGFLSYYDYETRAERGAVLWQYWAKDDPWGEGGWQCTPSGTEFVEPDFVGAAFEEMNQIFADRSLSKMEDYLERLHGMRLAAGTSSAQH